MAIENAIKSVSRIAYTTALTGLTNDDNLVLVTKGYVDSVASGIAVGEGNGITVSGTTVSVDGYGNNIKVDGNGVSATIPAWAANTAYEVGDVVYNNSVIYVCGTGKAHTSGNSFDTTKWTAISSTITSTSHSHTSTQISDGVVAYDGDKTGASYVVKTDGSTGKISSTLLPDLAITNVYVRSTVNGDGRKSFDSTSGYTHAEAGDVVIESYSTGTSPDTVSHNDVWMYVGPNATSTNTGTTIALDTNWKQLIVDPSPYALASHTHTINDLPYVADLENAGLDHSHVPTAGVLRQAITSLTNSLEGLTYSDVGAAPSSLSDTVSSIKQVPPVNNSSDGDKVLVSSYNSTTSTGSYAWGSVPSHTHTAAQLPGAYQEITVPSNNNKSSVSFNHEMTTEKLLVQVYERQGTDSNNYTYESVLVDTVVNGSTVTLNFASSPTAGKVYRVYVYPVYSNINATPSWA